MKTLIIVLFSLLFGENRTCLQADIIILADYSGSVQGQESFIYTAMYKFVDKFELSEEELKIGAFVFNGNIYKISPLTSDKNSLLRGISSLSSMTAYATTNLLEAMQEATNELLGPNSRQGYKKIIIIISDGVPDQPNEVLIAAQMLKSMNFYIYTVLIGNSGANGEYMQILASPGSYVNTDYNSLIKTVQNLDICL